MKRALTALAIVALTLVPPLAASLTHPSADPEGATRLFGDDVFAVQFDADDWTPRQDGSTGWWLAAAAPGGAASAYGAVQPSTPDGPFGGAFTTEGSGFAQRVRDGTVPYGWASSEYVSYPQQYTVAMFVRPGVCQTAEDCAYLADPSPCDPATVALRTFAIADPYTLGFGCGRVVLDVALPFGASTRLVGNAVPAGQWVHVAIRTDTWMGPRLLMDGVTVAWQNVDMNTQTHNVLFPVRAASQGVPFYGSLDEVRLVNRWLSDDELLQARTRPYIHHNVPPVADAGADQTLECAGSSTYTTLDGRGSYDPEGDLLSYQWSAPDARLLLSPTSSRPGGSFWLGTTTATLTVRDAENATSATTRVHVVDTTPPRADSVSLSSDDPGIPQVATPLGEVGVARGSLWFQATLVDTCSGVAEVTVFVDGEAYTTRQGTPYYVHVPPPTQPALSRVTAVGSDRDGNVVLLGDWTILRLPA